LVAIDLHPLKILLVGYVFWLTILFIMD